MLGDVARMPYATRKVCPFPGCDLGEKDDNGQPTPFITPEGISTRAEVSEELREHVHMAHELVVEHKKLEVAKINAEAAKIHAEAVKHTAENPPAPGQGLSVGPVSVESRAVKEKRAVIPRPTVES